MHVPDMQVFPAVQSMGVQQGPRFSLCAHWPLLHDVEQH
jgi:hypothetical protein